MFLLDTNVISEPTAKRPNAGVVAWMQSEQMGSAYISALSLGEMVRGVEQLKPGPKRARIASWLDEVRSTFFLGRILSFDERCAETWGRLTAASPRRLPIIDGLLAATALANDLIVVTRNERDFRDAGVRALNPFQ